MFSMNEWVVKGKAAKIEENLKGYWVTVKGVAENSTIFKSDKFLIDCWISKKTLGKSTIKNNVYFTGQLKFVKGDCFLIVHRVL